MGQDLIDRVGGRKGIQGPDLVEPYDPPREVKDSTWVSKASLGAPGFAGPGAEMAFSATGYFILLATVEPAGLSHPPQSLLQGPPPFPTHSAVSSERKAPPGQL